MDPNNFLNNAPIEYVTNSELQRVFDEGNEVYEQGKQDFPSFSNHVFSGGYIDPDATESDDSLSASQQLDRYPHIQDESNLQSLNARFGGLPPSSPSFGDSSESFGDILTSPSVLLNQSRQEQRQRAPSQSMHPGDVTRHHIPKQPTLPKKSLFKTATETTKKLFPDMRRSVVNNEATKRTEPSMAMIPSPQKPQPQYRVNPNIPKVDMSFLRQKRPTSVEFSPVKQYHEIPSRHNAFQPRGNYYSPQFDQSYDDSFEQRYEMYDRPGRGGGQGNRGNQQGNHGSRNHSNRNNQDYGRNHSNNPRDHPRDRDPEDDWEDDQDYTPNVNINTPCRTPKPKRESRDNTRESREHDTSSSSTPQPPSALNLPILLSIWLQLAYNAIIMAVVSYFVWTFYSTVKRDVDMKVDEYSADILQEMAMCSKDYLANNCMPGKRVPALETMCNAWERCMNRDPKIVGRARVSAETFAEIINGFLRPISFKSMVFVMVMLVGSLFVCNFGFGSYRGPLYQQVKESDKDKKEDKKEKKTRERERERERGEYERVYDSPSFYVSPRYYRHRGGRRRY